jgi:hypothetical protein
MSAEPVPAYHHTQKAPWALLIAATGVASILGAVLIWQVPVAPVALAVAGVGMLVVASAFRQLTVTDEGDHLLVAFGPLPLFTKRIRYADIRSVEVGRTLLVEGWGVHYSVRGGWVWNIWGRRCVVIHHSGTTRVGTDDPENLVRFLKAKMSPSSQPVA